MALEKIEIRKKRIASILRTLKSRYPDARCSLIYDSPFQLLCATILSAQCTDARVNLVTPRLFEEFPDAFSMAKAKPEQIEKIIQSTGFFRSKAKSLLFVAKEISEKFAGNVPNDQEALVKMRGVGRKTANVVRGVAFKEPALVVDTHVGRLSRRMGLTQLKDPVKVEFALMDIVSRKDWTILAHLFIDHGRAICTARQARCGECFVRDRCPQVGVASKTKKAS